MVTLAAMDKLERLRCATAREWEAWLEANHAEMTEVWLQFGKKDAGVTTVTYAEAVELALCFGWIDGQARGLDAVFYLQRFTPRRPKSIWSQINRAKAEKLVADGRMRRAGLEAVQRAKADGRWDAAYAGSRTIEVPDDLTRALRRNAAARRAFAALDSANRYAILFRIHDAKRPETRARRIEQFTTMLAEGRTIH